MWPSPLVVFPLSEEVSANLLPLPPDPPPGAAQDAQDPDAEVTIATLSRRDANAFVRAVKRFGLLSHVTEICAETGSKVVEEMGLGQKRALFHTLLDGCRRAVDMAGEDPKVRAGSWGV